MEEEEGPLEVANRDPVAGADLESKREQCVRLWFGNSKLKIYFVRV